MTVQEWIDRLQTFPPNAIVVIENSINGANFSPLDGLYSALYHPSFQCVMPYTEGVQPAKSVMEECVNAIILRAADFNTY